jgi:nitronate monooxygenase
METSSLSSAKPWNHTRISSSLEIEYPVIQGPLGGLSSQRLTATVSNAGGLGSFGAHGCDPAAIKDVIAEIRLLTSKPFAMNLWVSMEDDGAFASDVDAFARSLSHISGHIEALGGALPFYRPHAPIRFEHQARVLLDAKVPVFTFIFGVPPKEILDECRAQQITTIGAATTREEAIVLEQAGVDVIAASGFEAGGHRGSFLLPAERSLTGTFSLVPQIADAVSIPVVAAGGIGDARGIVAAFALGAEGVQIGTAFLATKESGASEHHRQALLSGKAGRTELTTGFTGRLARGIHNQLLEDLNLADQDVLPYPLQRMLLKSLSVHAERAGRPDLLALWAGQSASLSRDTDAEALFRRMISEISTIAAPVLEWGHKLRYASDSPKTVMNPEV